MKKSFKDLVAFQRAIDLVAVVYEITREFPADERFGLVSQLRRAAVGIPSSIAEGQGRLTFGEWRQHLSHARGSLFEVEAQFLAARRLHFIDDEGLAKVDAAIQGTGKALVGLIRWVMRKERSTPQPRNLGTAEPFNAAPTTRSPCPPARAPQTPSRQP